jgi:hypothetical protein
MTIDEIMLGLARAEEWIPHESVEAARAAPAEVAPRLLRRLEELSASLRAGERPCDAELVSILYLLAELRETRALPLVLGLLDLPEEVLDDYFGDFLGEGLDEIAASVSGGDAAPLLRLAEDPRTYVGARCCAVNAMLCLVAAERIPRETAIEWLRSVLQRGVRGEGPEAGHELWDSVFLTALDLYPGEIRDDLEAARAKGLFDPDNVSWTDLDEVIEAGKEEVLEVLQETYGLIGDAGAAIESYLVGDEGAECPVCGEEHGHSHEHGEDDGDVAAEPIVREAPRVGRNDPCPCGSGKKHKKCCGKGS